MLYTWPPANSFLRGMDFLTAPGRADAVARGPGQHRSRSPARRSTWSPTAAPASRCSARSASRAGRRSACWPWCWTRPPSSQQAVRRSGFAGFDVSLADVTRSGAPRTLVGRPGRPRRPRRLPRSRWPSAAAASSCASRRRVAYMAEQRGLASWTVLTAGLLLTALLGALMLLISGERAADRGPGGGPHRAPARPRSAPAGDPRQRRRRHRHRRRATACVVSANPATAALFGYPPAHLQGLPFTTLVPGADGETAPSCWRAWPAAPPEERELDGINARGEPFPLAVSVSPVELPGERLYVCILRDLTEQQPLAGPHPPPGPPRSAHRPGEPPRARPAPGAAAGAGAPLAASRWRCCSSTSTTSRRSTTRSATRPATSCWWAPAARMKDLLRDVDTLARLGGDEFIIVLGGPLDARTA